MTRDQAFEVLEIHRGATEEEIRHAYKDLVRIWHPDRLGSDPKLQLKAQEKLKLINYAYQTLQVEKVSAETFEEPHNKTAAEPSNSKESTPRSRNNPSASPERLLSIGNVLRGMALVVALVSIFVKVVTQKSNSAATTNPPSQSAEATSSFENIDFHTLELESVPIPKEIVESEWTQNRSCLIQMFPNAYDSSNGMAEYEKGLEAKAFDLNGDGVPELIVMDSSPCNSGSGGASVSVFQKTPQNYRKLLSVGVAQSLLPSLQSRSPWRDLIYTSGSGVYVDLYRNDGNGYKRIVCLQALSRMNCQN